MFRNFDNKITSPFGFFVCLTPYPKILLLRHSAFLKNLLCPCAIRLWSSQMLGKTLSPQTFSLLKDQDGGAVHGGGGLGGGGGEELV